MSAESPTRKLEVEVFADVTNCPVLRHPGRHFPGVLIQGDSLESLHATSRAAIAALDAGRLEEAKDELDALREQLADYKAVYEDALRRAGMRLPYVT